jgi:phytoene desaturase
MAHIVVIGSGFGGLGAAIRLAARGHDVEIFEKRDKLGGRAYVYEVDGFKFDGGPTVITAPFMFDDLWATTGRKREDYFEMVQLDPFYRIFNDKGQPFDYNSDEAFILEQIRKFNPDDAAGYQRFMETTQAIFQKGFVELADKPFLHFTDMLKVAPDLIKMQSYLSVYSYVAQFVKDEFLRRCFSFHPLLIGGNPFDAPSIYAMIHYLEREWGIHYVKGGTGAMVAGMGRLFEDIGGKIHLNAEISEITVDPNDHRRVTGVRLGDGTVVKADHVVSNADVAFTYRNLIAPEYRRTFTDQKIDSLKYSMSLFVIYFGTKRQYREQGLSHHNIILSTRYKELLKDIFKRKVLADDFSLYLHMPTLTDPSIAPEGHEAFYARMSTGRRWPGPTATASCSSSRTTTCPTCRPISSPNTPSTRCTSSKRSTAIWAPPSRCSRFCCRARGSARTTARRISTTCISWARARTRARACRAYCRRRSSLKI